MLMLILKLLLILAGWTKFKIIYYVYMQPNLTLTNAYTCMHTHTHTPTYKNTHANTHLKLLFEPFKTGRVKLILLLLSFHYNVLTIYLKLLNQIIVQVKNRLEYYNTKSYCSISGIISCIYLEIIQCSQRDSRSGYYQIVQN